MLCADCGKDTTDLAEYNEVKRVWVGADQKPHVEFTPARDLCVGCHRTAIRLYVARTKNHAQ